MRLVHYYVVNKSTGEAINIGCHRSKAEKLIATKADPKAWIIGYKWLSV